MCPLAEDRPNAAMLHSPNKLKLAIFGMNVSGGTSISLAEGTLKVNWPETVRLAQMADAIGIEGLIPVGRWRGYGGPTNFNDRCFETMTWGAGLAAVTKGIQMFATVHVPTLHPTYLAKQVATVDHISGGRFGLNIVSGWNEKEMRMFAIKQKDHDERYAVADEWITLAKRLWSEDMFDFEGEYFQSFGARSEPKPLQRPSPVLIGAGGSPAGTDFAAKHCDIQFLPFSTLDGAAEKIHNIKQNAVRNFGRPIKVMGLAHICCRATEKEARDYYNYYVHEKGDWEAAENVLTGAVGQQVALKREMLVDLVAGFGAMPLIGTAEQVVVQMQALSDVGLDGITVSWLDYESGLEQFGREIHPIMQGVGLRA